MTDDALDVTAYVDGEMDGEQRRAFEARLPGDAALRARVERARRLREMLGAAYAPVLEEPVPERLGATLRRPVVSLAAERAKRRPSWAQLGGMAASLLIGLVVGRQFLPPATSDEGLQARGTLARALDEKLSGEALGEVRPGLSFVAKGGAYCRSFQAGASAGLACRDEGKTWQLRQLMPALPAAAGAYRTAGSALPVPLLEAIDQLRDGEVLDAQQEAQARARGWR